MKNKHKRVALKIGLERNRAMCYRKKKFNQKQALYKATQMKQRAYECPVCGNYHLTSNGTK